MSRVTSVVVYADQAERYDGGRLRVYAGKPAPMGNGLVGCDLFERSALGLLEEWQELEEREHYGSGSFTVVATHRGVRSGPSHLVDRSTDI